VRSSFFDFSEHSGRKSGDYRKVIAFFVLCEMENVIDQNRAENVVSCISG